MRDPRLQVERQKIRDRQIRGKIDRAAIEAKSDGKCADCGISFARHGVKKTLDHIVPINRGGLHETKNLRLVCMPCNSAKNDGDAPTGKFGKWLRGKGLTIREFSNITGVGFCRAVLLSSERIGALYRQEADIVREKFPDCPALDMEVKGWHPDFKSEARIAVRFALPERLFLIMKIDLTEHLRKCRRSPESPRG